MTLSLFPLPLVLFPGELRPLHIFEERYKLMINRCLASDNTFGLVLARDATPPCVSIGTTAEIIKVERLKDGRMNIQTIGVSRFRIDHFYTDEAYLRADVTLIPEEEDTSAQTATMKNEAGRLFLHYLATLLILNGRSEDEVRTLLEQISLPQSALALANLIAAHLQVDVNTKQDLLELSTMSERLTTEITLLRSELGLMGRALNRYVEQPRPHAIADLN